MSRINKRIIDKINKSSYDKTIKEFLKAILIIELEHVVRGTLLYSREYDRYILKYVKERTRNGN